MKFLLTFLVVFAASLGVIHGLKCYKCNYNSVLSGSSSYCGDTFNDDDPAAETNVVTCSGVCTKGTSEVYGINAVERGCMNSTGNCPNKCQTVSGGGSSATACSYCCSTDLCNGASSVTFNLMAAVAMLVCAMAFLY